MLEFPLHGERHVGVFFFNEGTNLYGEGGGRLGVMSDDFSLLSCPLPVPYSYVVYNRPPRKIKWVPTLRG